MTEDRLADIEQDHIEWHDKNGMAQPDELCDDCWFITKLKAAQTRIADLEALVRRMDDEKGISDLNKRVDSYIIRIAELMHDKGYQFPAVGEI